MKLIRPFISGAVACSVALILAATAAAQTEQGTIKVVNVHGLARYTTPDNQTYRPLKAGTVLKPGAVIQTASESYVDIVFNNPNAVASGIASASPAITATPTAVKYAQPKSEQDAVRILENTVLGVDKLTITQTGADRVTETQLNLKVGRIFGTVKKLSAASKYEITIPSGVAGIRGTIYFISSTGEVSILSSVTDLLGLAPPGSMILAYVAPDGTTITQIIGPGQHFDITTGQLTPIPEALYNDMVNWARQLGAAPGGQVLILNMDDPTIYYVSGIVGQNPGGSGTQPLGLVAQGQAAPKKAAK
jgi:hypothetical protein